MRKIVPILQLLARAFINLSANDPIRMAAATAFFAFFALPSILIILSQLYGDWLTGDRRWVNSQLFRELADLFGPSSARQLRDISRSLQKPRSSEWLTALSLVLLFLASTTLFTTIKNSLNQLWNVKSTAQGRVWPGLLTKLVALGIIIFSGFLFTVSLSLHKAVSTLSADASSYAWLAQLAHQSLSVLVLTIWFGLVFKYLPDVRIHWQAVWVGGLVTALLVELGEVILDRLLINSPVRSFYGSAGSTILVLLFVFYCSLIFYYGASFTRQYALWQELATEPGANSVAYQINEIPDQKPPAAS